MDIDTIMLIALLILAMISTVTIVLAAVYLPPKDILTPYTPITNKEEVGGS